MDAIGVEHAYFSGESLGGWTAARLAIDHPEKVDRVVLNTMGGTMANPKVMERLYTLSMEAAKDPSWERVRARLEWLMADPTMVTDDLIKTRQAIFQQPDWLQACEANMALQNPEIRKRNMITDDDLRSMKVPALVLWTTKDPSGPVDEGRRIAELIPGGQARGDGGLRALAAVRGHRDLQQDPPRLPARPLTATQPTPISREKTVPHALVAMSHSPLLHHVQPSAEVKAEVEAGFEATRAFVKDFDPDLIINFAPDHYNGFFYNLMPPFCIGYEAIAIGDYDSQAGPLDVPYDLAQSMARSVIESGVDTAISLRMEIDHGAVQPMEIIYGDITAKPVIPVFINSVAPPFTPIARIRALGAGDRDMGRRAWTRRCCSSPPVACPTTRRCRASRRPPRRSGTCSPAAAGTPPRRPARPGSSGSSTPPTRSSRARPTSWTSPPNGTGN